nr:PIN domain-containing protein [uncultured Sphingosinicella sp.]
MILVDSSVWIDHLRKANTALSEALKANRVLAHRYVIGELALGSLKDRSLIPAKLGRLPHAVQATDSEVMHLIEGERLFGTGIGYVDAHLIGSARLTFASLWTRDKQLRAVADRLGLASADP